MRKLIAAALAWAAIALAASAEPVSIVAAETVYGDVAKQIGGSHVTIMSILGSPDQDPHEFEAGASAARALADAKLVVFNGAGYDPWAAKLLAASSASSRQIIEVAKLRVGAAVNPHLWYDVNAVSALASALASKLSGLDPPNAADYASGLAAFEASMKALRERIAAMRDKYSGSAVTATEPVFDYMADALGLAMRNRRFALAIMNGTEPGAAAIAAIEQDLRGHKVKVLLYNRQTGAALAQRMRTIANEAGVPVVVVSESEPPGQSYQAWMLSQLDALDRALGSR